MKIKSWIFPATVCIILTIITGICCAGCTSAPSSSPGSPSAGSTPLNSEEATPTGEASAAAALSSAGISTTTTYLSEGITLEYPSDWKMEEVSETSLRDYGRTTTNIANFYSPDITPERARAAEPNSDKSKYSSLSIDIDPTPVSDFEQYFNLASLALNSKYENFAITKHNYQLKMSVTDDFSGYKAYQLNFDAKNIRKSYIFTDVDGTVCIFIFKNPSPYSAEVDEMIDSVRISLPEKTETRNR